MPKIDDAEPIAQVATTLGVPLTTLRSWIKKDGLVTDIRKKDRTRVLYLPTSTIHALRARKQRSPLLVPEPPPLDAVTPLLPTKTEAPVVVFYTHLVRASCHVLRSLFNFTCVPVTQSLVRPKPLRYVAQSARPMKLRIK